LKIDLNSELHHALKNKEHTITLKFYELEIGLTGREAGNRCNNGNVYMHQ